MVHELRIGLRIGLEPQLYWADQSGARDRFCDSVLRFPIWHSPIERNFGARFLRASPVSAAGGA